MIRRLRHGPLLCLGLLATGCVFEAGGAEEPDSRETHTVEIRDMAFHPADLRVNPGDTVVWINRGLVPHTATSPDSTWSSPPLARGERWSMVVSASENGGYLCAFHPVMEARLVVTTPSTEDPQ